MRETGSMSMRRVMEILKGTSVWTGVVKRVVICDVMESPDAIMILQKSVSCNFKVIPIPATNAFFISSMNKMRK